MKPEPLSIFENAVGHSEKRGGPKASDCNCAALLKAGPHDAGIFDAHDERASPIKFVLDAVVADRLTDVDLFAGFRRLKSKLLVVVEEKGVDRHWGG